MTDTSVVFNILAKDNASGVFGKIGKAAGGMVAGFAAFQGVEFAKDVIAQASDLAETQSKVGVIFGQSAGAIQAWAATADKALGQSKQQALDAAATFATFGKSAGLSGDNLTGFSTKMVQLASDMASFSNTSPQEAIEAIGAAMRGESDPIEKYGVLINQAAVAAQAMSMGLIKTTVDATKVKMAQEGAALAQQKYNEAVAKHGQTSTQAAQAHLQLEKAQAAVEKAAAGVNEQLTPQQRILATQALIMQQTTAAQGDFARTSGGLANQQRIMAAEFANVKAQLGQQLLPVVSKFATVLMSVMQYVSAHQDTFKKLAVVLGIAAGGIWLVNAAMTVWNIIAAANPIVLIIVALVALGVALVILWKKSETFREIVMGALHGIAAAGLWLWHNVLEPFWQFWSTGFRLAWQIVSSFAALWWGIWSNTVGKILLWFWHEVIERAWAGIKLEFAIGSAVVHAIIDKVSGKVKAVGSVFKSIFGAIGGYVGDAFKSAASIAKSGFNVIIDLINGAIGGINSLINAANKVPGVNFPHLPTIPHLATGGYIRAGGMAVVGENGPELVRLPSGSEVYPNGTGPGGGGFNVHFSGNVDTAFATAFQMLIRSGQITISSAAVV